MNKLFVLIVLLSVLPLSAQQQELDKTFYPGFRASVGAVFDPNVDFGLYSVGLQWRNEKLQGFGLDFSFASFESSNLNTNPDPELVANFDGVGTPWEELNYSGSQNDNVILLSPYYAYGIPFNSRIFFELQGGPSLGLYREREFSYAFIPGQSCGVGAFFCNRPGPTLQISSSDGGFEFTYGAYLRAAFNFKAGESTYFELGGVSFITAEEVVIGFQLGFSFW